MYTCELLDGKLTVSIAGEPVLEDILPHVTMDDGTVLALTLTSAAAESYEDLAGEGVVHAFSYRDADERLEVTLRLRVGDGSLVASAAVSSLGRPNIGVRAKGLAPFGGLQLSVARFGAVEGLMANYLHKDWWTRPHFDPDLSALPPRTQSVVWQTAHTYHQLLCVCDNAFKTELAGSPGGVLVQTSAYAAGYVNVEMVMFVLASDDDPFALPDRTVGTGMAVLEKGSQVRVAKRYPETFEYLGWCSWDAFREEVSAAGVLDKAAELYEKGLPVRWFIIDSGWLHTNEQRLKAFEPDPVKFPDGLAPLIAKLKGTYDLWWVGVWHTLFGFWGGIDSESELARSMADTLVTMRNGMVVPSADAAKGFRFWDTWHTELREAGVDFVKVDCQSGLAAFWRHEMAVGKTAEGVHNGLEASVGKAFDNVMINCMGMATEDLWHRPTSAMNRNSDDFFPNQEASFVEHALQNGYNAYYHAPFMWLDWDMWWTKHEHATTHAILRALSGGPVYVSDRVGETDPAQLWPLILSDGRLLRCDEPGKVTEDCLLIDPSKQRVPLKIWNRVGDAGIVAAVHVCLAEDSVNGDVGPSDVPGLEGEQFVVYEYFTQRSQVVDREARLPVELAPGDSALYTITPLAGAVTPIGLVDKYVAPATVADWFETPEKTSVVLLDGGRFAWAADDAPIEVRVNGEVAEFEAGDGFYAVDCSSLWGSVWVEIMHP